MAENLAHHSLKNFKKPLDRAVFLLYNIDRKTKEKEVKKMNDKEKIISNYILLHTIKMRNIMTKILTEQNYDSMLKLIKINSTKNVFRF